MRHESKCRHLHGHCYTAEITAHAVDGLDELGRVIDFSVLKTVIGGWIDSHWDHGTVVNSDDDVLIQVCEENDWKLYQMNGNPTAENMAKELFVKSNGLLSDHPVQVTHVRLYETPNCWADYGSGYE